MPCLGRLEFVSKDSCEFHPPALAAMLLVALLSSRGTSGAVMGLRWIFALSVCVGISPVAFAGQSSGILHRVSCSVIRFYVAKYSAPAAEQWARNKGATEAEIEEARHCLRAETIRTAKAPTRPFALGSYSW